MSCRISCIVTPKLCCPCNIILKQIYCMNRIVSNSEMDIYFVVFTFSRAPISSPSPAGRIYTKEKLELVNWWFIILLEKSKVLGQMVLELNKFGPNLIGSNIWRKSLVHDRSMTELLRFRRCRTWLTVRVLGLGKGSSIQDHTEPT